MKLRRLHSWNVTPRQAIQIQKKLEEKVRLKKWGSMPRFVAGVDAGFKNGWATGVVVVLDYPALKVVEQVVRRRKLTFPYVPGLLTFREGPVVEKCFEALKTKPDVILFDGQGIAHPRGIGLATHIGILLNEPTVGCAKTRLFGTAKEPGQKRGSFSYLLDPKGRKVGALLRTRDGVRPVYVSPGQKTDIASAIRLVLLCTARYRLPEPLRLAHQLTQG